MESRDFAFQLHPSPMAMETWRGPLIYRFSPSEAALAVVPTPTSVIRSPRAYYAPLGSFKNAVSRADQ